MRHCKVKNCWRKFRATELCPMHYLRKWRTGKVGPAGVIKKKCAIPWIKRNPMALKAHRAVEKAIKKGMLWVEPCEECLKINMQNIHAHHDDYSKPLEVRWLCGKHHWGTYRK